MESQRTNEGRVRERRSRTRRGAPSFHTRKAHRTLNDAMVDELDVSQGIVHARLEAFFMIGNHRSRRRSSPCRLCVTGRSGDVLTGCCDCGLLLGE